MQEEVILREIEANSAKLDNIEEKQDIFGDSLQNKYNQLSKTVGKIHQNVKSNNHKYSVLMDNIGEMKHLIENFNSNIDSQQDNEVKLNVKPVVIDRKSVRIEDYKTFMFKYFNKNLKITRNPHNVVDMNEISTKVVKYIEKEDIDIDVDALNDRLESYLKAWYNSHDVNIGFEDIISVSISKKKLYSYLKFININEERENKIKNTIIAWLKEHTCEVEGSKTYTEDILRNIQPIFEDNGWLITTPDEYKQLQQAGFTRVCVKRTFSQIIGKAVQELYSHISKDTTQRDTPCNGYVTWYPNIEIIDRNISDELKMAINDELSNDIFESDNAVFRWLNSNLVFTARDEDVIGLEVLMEHIRKYLKNEGMLIGEDTLQRVVNDTLMKLSKRYTDDISLDDGVVRQFKLLPSTDISEIIGDWISNHLVSTEDEEDRVYLDVLDEKLLTLLYKENVTIVKDDMYRHLPDTIKNNFIQESHYRDTLNTILKSKMPELSSKKSYIQKVKLMEYKVLDREDISKWVNAHIEELLKGNVSKKKSIIENFKRYLEENNTKNTSEVGIEELVDEEIQTYYENLQNTTLKLLTDSQEEYYVLIQN